MDELERRMQAWVDAKFAKLGKWLIVIIVGSIIAALIYVLVEVWIQ
jgi:hypothetical protein